MNIDRRAVEPFNTWWRSFNHCEPSQIAVSAFNSGFKAGMQRAVDEACAIIEGKPAQSTSEGKHGG